MSQSSRLSDSDPKRPSIARFRARSHIGTSRPPEMSNSGCLPGRAGGPPLAASRKCSTKGRFEICHVLRQDAGRQRGKAIPAGIDDHLKWAPSAERWRSPAAAYLIGGCRMQRVVRLAIRHSAQVPHMVGPTAPLPRHQGRANTSRAQPTSDDACTPLHSLSQTGCRPQTGGRDDGVTLAVPRIPLLLRRVDNMAAPTAARRVRWPRFIGQVGG